jgi:hypothetical protein
MPTALARAGGARRPIARLNFQQANSLRKMRKKRKKGSALRCHVEVLF